MASLYPARLHASKVIKHLLPLLPAAERNKPQLLYLQSKPVTFRDDTDRELLFRQESNFFYLTGCHVPDSGLLVSFLPEARAENLLSTLFIPEEDPLDTIWSPPPPTLDEASVDHEVSQVQYTKVLRHLLPDLIAARPTSILHVLPSEHFPVLPEAVSSLKPTSAYLLEALHLSRLTKTPYEIELIRKANAISSRAHELVMKLLGRDAGGTIKGSKGGEMPGEWHIEKEDDAEAVFVASCRREGAIHQAYLPIVAASTRASTLHYCCNDKEFSWGPVSHSHSSDLAHELCGEEKALSSQVLLIDAGCEWQNYASDITRVMPIGNGGQFSKEAGEIYAIVLKMQEEAIKSLRPGLHWDHVQLQCHITLVLEFLKLGIFIGSKEEVLASGVSASFFPHGVGHSLGLDVHDVPSASKPIKKMDSPESSDNPEFYTYLRLRRPLEEGMVLTVEPGCYFSPHLLAPVRQSKYIAHDLLAMYEHVGGVRIEDVLVITVDGCENLTTARKDVAFVESLCSGKAV